MNQNFQIQIIQLLIEFKLWHEDFLDGLIDLQTNLLGTIGSEQHIMKLKLIICTF